MKRLFAAAVSAWSLIACSASGISAEERPGVLRIGYQKSSTLISILKHRGTLEEGLMPLGVKVEWSEFTSGLPLLEALNIGSVDLSADVADTVPLFAQAAGGKLTYIAQETPSPAAQAIVVREDAAIKSVADLKGKKIAVTKAAGSHFLLIAALEHAGLAFKDIEPAYLSPADGRAAFASGNVDAWVTWDPFFAAVQSQAKVRVLSDGKNLASYRRYYLARSEYVHARADVLNYVFGQLQQTGRWVKGNPADAAALLSTFWKLESSAVELANSRRSYDVQPVKRDQLGEQQKIADTFLAAGLLPKKLDASDVAIWEPAPRSN